MIPICKRSKLLLMSFGAILYFVPAALAQTKTLQYNTPVDENIPGFFEYLPAGYFTQPEKDFPLMIFMHGLGTSGDGTEGNLENVVLSGWGTPPWRSWAGLIPESFAVNGVQQEFILITPQFLNEPYTSLTWEHDINALLYYCYAHYRVNRNRVYLAGQSAGAACVLNFAGSNDTNAVKVAGILASSPGPREEFAPTSAMGNTIAKNLIPVWISVNELDLSYPLDKGNFKRTADAWINVLTNATPTPFYVPRYSIMPGEHGHNDAAIYLYNPNTDEDGMNGYEWILQFERSSVVPVQITELNVQNTGNLILLNWSAPFNTNNKGFNVQQSHDGIHFKHIGFVAASGNGYGGTYRFTCVNPLEGMNYFRLEQIDNDGRKSYSDIVNVRFTTPGQLVVTPNPVHNMMTISFGAVLQNATIRIFDNNGKLQREVKGIHSDRQQIDVSGLAKGFYTGRIITAGSDRSFTFIKN